MTQKRTSVHATMDWEELNSTQSEADVCMRLSTLQTFLPFLDPLKR
jgi:hypothetical protein